MSYKKLNARITGSWSSYAASAFGVITDCGMWDLDKDRYGSFLGLTGICFQTIYNKECGAESVTSYDWEQEHLGFLQRIGVTTDLCCAYNGEHHKTALYEIKASLDANKCAVLWGVDSGEFGVVYGYDDGDGVFFVSGIGGNDSGESSPLLYENLGSTFGNILFCQFPLSCAPRPVEDMINDSLRYYISHMKSANKIHGLNAYGNLINALENKCNDFGLRYTSGVYAERKQQAYSFFNDEVRTLYQNNANAEKAAVLYNEISKLYEKIHFEMLEQDFNGWNHLKKPVTNEIKQAIIPVIKEIALKEAEAVGLVEALFFE